VRQAFRDYDGGVKVEAAVSAQMVRLSTGATVWANSVSEVGQVDKRSAVRGFRN